MFTWNRGGLGLSLEIQGQRFDAAGNEVGGEITINTNLIGDQTAPSVTVLANGGFVVTWDSDGQDGSDTGVYAQQFEAQLFGTGGADTISDTIGANRIDGRGGQDELYGNSGADVILGGAGADDLFGGNGGDTLNGGGGGDALTGGAGTDTLNGGGGADDLFGGKGADVLLGGKGADYLRGGAGNDTLTGGAGNDVLIGGGGNDNFIFGNNFGDDRINDFDANSNAEDIDFSGNNHINSFTDLMNNHAVQSGDDVVITDGGNSLVLRDVSLGDLNAADFIF